MRAHKGRLGEGTNPDTKKKRTKWPPQNQLNIPSTHFKGQSPHKDLALAQGSDLALTEVLVLGSAEFLQPSCGIFGLGLSDPGQGGSRQVTKSFSAINYAR